MRGRYSNRILAQARKKYGRPQYPGRGAMVKTGEAVLNRKLAGTPHEVWCEVLKVVKEEVSSVSYETWIEPCKLLKLEGNKVILGVENGLYKEMLERRHLNVMRAVLKKVTAQEMEIELVVSDEYR